MIRQYNENNGLNSKPCVNNQKDIDWCENWLCNLALMNYVSSGDQMYMVAFMSIIQCPFHTLLQQGNRRSIMEQITSWRKFSFHNMLLTTAN